MRTGKVPERKTRQSHSYFKARDLPQIRPSASHLAVIGHLDLKQGLSLVIKLTAIGDPLFEFVPSTHVTIQEEGIDD